MNNEHYKTSDLGLAAALLTSGVALINMDFSNPRRVHFVFRDSELARATSSDYWASRLTVDALSYFENTKLLKSRVYGGVR